MKAKTPLPKPKGSPYAYGDNAFRYLGDAQRFLRAAGATQTQVKSVLDDMQSSDYDHLYSVYLSLWTQGDDS